MSDNIIEKIYKITEKYPDPLSSGFFDKNNKNINIINKNGNINISININLSESSKYDKIEKNLKEKILEIKGVFSVTIALTSEKKMENKLSEKKFHINSKNIIAVASGKGGVGKSTFAVNFASALKLKDKKVGILDADIYGPSIPRMMGIEKKPYTNEKNKLVPLENYGIKCMSIGFLIDVDTPTIWRGPMIMKALEQMFNSVEWGELDYLIIDLPPGTGDAQLTLAQNSKLSGSIIISTPQDVALIDARKGINMFNKVNVPIIGIVENMSYFICDSCNTRHEIFSHGSVKDEALKYKVPYLGELPINTNLRINSDKGNLICMEEPSNSISKIYISIAEKIINLQN